MRQHAVNDLRHLGGSGETNPGDTRIGSQRPAHRRAVSRQQLQRGLRQTRLAHQRHRARGDHRRLLGRLGDDRVAGGERGGDLTAEDRQRKIPRADTDEHATGATGRLVFEPFRLVGVVPQEVDRLAHLGDTVKHHLAGFARGDRGQLGDVVLVEVGNAA